MYLIVMYLIALSRGYPLLHLRPFCDLDSFTHMCKIIRVDYMLSPIGSIFGLFLELTFSFDLPAPFRLSPGPDDSGCLYLLPSISLPALSWEALIYSCHSGPHGTSS